MKVIWFTPAEDELKDTKVPKWARYVARAEDGTIFVPSIIAGGEMEIMLCASFDGTQCLLDEHNHTFYPLDWMMREFPRAQRACQKIAALTPEYE